MNSEIWYPERSGFAKSINFRIAPIIQTKILSRKPLENPEFRRLWTGLTLARLGTEFAILALVWFLLDITGSGLAIGAVLLCFQLPCILTGPLIGHILDRHQPCRIMVIGSFCQAVVMLMIPALHWLGSLETWHLYVLAILSGILAPACDVGVPVLIPHLVKDDRLEEANALLSLTWEMATMLGPAAAGLLVDRLGGPLVITFDSMALAGMGFITLSLPDISRKPVKESDLGSAKMPGLIALVSARAPGLLTGLMLLMLFVQGFQSVALAVFSRRMLAAGATDYGLILSSFGAGSILGLFLFSRLSLHNNRPGVVLAILFILFGLCIFPIAFVRNLLFVMVFLLLGGIFAAPFFVIERSIVQRIVPEHLRGKFFGIRGALSISGYPLGSAAAGYFLEIWQAPLVIGLSALVCIIAGVAGLFSATLVSLLQDG